MRRYLILTAVLLTFLVSVAHAQETSSPVQEPGVAEEVGEPAAQEVEDEGESLEALFEDLDLGAENRSLPECSSLLGEPCWPGGSTCLCWNSGYLEYGICYCLVDEWIGCH